MRYKLLGAKGGDVGCGEAHLSTLFKAVCHVARYTVGASEAAASLRHIALGKQAAHKRRRHTQAVDIHRGVEQHVDAHLLAVGGILVEALGTVVTEAVVVAYEQAAHPEAVVQHLLHKLLGRQLSHLQVEVQHLHTVYTRGFE